MRVLFRVISIVVFVVVAGAFFLPSKLHVARSITIKAPPAAVFDQLQTFRKWEAWAPWFQRDRFLVTDFSGAESGTGSIMSWSSKKEGDGMITMVSASLAAGIRMAVSFGDSGEANTWFTLRDSGAEETEITWSFEADFGHNMGRRYFGLMLRRAVERDLDEGLANLKALLEKPAAAAP